MYTRYLGAHLRARCIQEQIQVKLKSGFGISTKSEIKILIENLETLRYGRKI